MPRALAGEATDIVRNPDGSSRFNLLVDYQEQTLLSGIVGAEVPFETQLLEGALVELLATLATDDSIDALVAISMRLLPE